MNMKNMVRVTILWYVHLENDTSENQVNVYTFANVIAKVVW